MKSKLTTPSDPLLVTSVDLSDADAVVVDSGDYSKFVAGKVDGEFYIADYIVNNVSNANFYRDFGILYRFISRAIDLQISKIVMSIPLSNEDKIYRQHFEMLPDGRFVFDIKKRYAQIDELALTHNILPMDTYETLPVEHKYGDTPEKYGCVVELNIPQIDPERLREELDRYAGQERPHYVSDRFEKYIIPAAEVINYLRYVGFTTEKYASYPVNIQGTAELDPNAPEYVKFVFGQLESKVFRHNYVISRNGWQTIWHKDHATPNVHGFRLMIPMDPVVMDFKYGRYVLTPGKYYFVNNSLLHKGVIPEGFANRANLMGQMASDVDILKGTIVLGCG